MDKTNKQIPYRHIIIPGGSIMKYIQQISLDVYWLIRLLDAQYTPPTPTRPNCRVESRRRRRYVLVSRQQFLRETTAVYWTPCSRCMKLRSVYTVSQKGDTKFFYHSFVKYWSIFNILLLAHSVVFPVKIPRHLRRVTTLPCEYR